MAKVLHHISRRRTASFVPVGCSALAAADREGGLFNEAEKGTLFFDEIGELPELWQGKLVQAMEDIKVHRAGATTSPFADVRLIVDNTSGNHSQAARVLGIDRRTRYRRLFEMENDGVRE